MAGVIISPDQYYLGGGNTAVPRYADAFLEGQRNAVEVGLRQQLRSDMQRRAGYDEQDRALAADARLRMRKAQEDMGALKPAFDAPIRPGVALPGVRGPVPAAPHNPSRGLATGMLPAGAHESESSGRSDVINPYGYGGLAQFGPARLADAAAAGIIPKGTTVQDFAKNPEMQLAVERWHVSDITSFMQAKNLDRFVGTTVMGIPVTVDGMLMVAHLGGKEGLQKFLESGGEYNPADQNGTRLSDYLAKFAGAEPSRGGVAIPQGQSALGTVFPQGVIPGLVSAIAPEGSALQQTFGEQPTPATPEYKGWQGPVTIQGPNGPVSVGATKGDAQAQPAPAPGVTQPAPIPAPTAGVAQPGTGPAESVMATPPGQMLPAPEIATYANNPQKMTADQRNLRSYFDYLQKQKQIMMSAPDANLETAAAIGAQQWQLVLQDRHLNRIQTVFEFESGNVGPLMGGLSQAMGANVQLQPVGQDSFNIFVNGRLYQQNLTREQVRGLSKQWLDQVYLQEQKELQKTLLDAQLEIQKKSAEQAGTQTIENDKKRWDMATETLKQRYALEGKMLDAAQLKAEKLDDGTIMMYAPDGSRVAIINPNGTVTLPDGTQLTGATVTNVGLQ